MISPRFGEKRRVTIPCPKHGEQPGEEMFLVSQWTIATCPECMLEQEAQEAADRSRREIEQAERRRLRSIEQERGLLQHRLQNSGIPARFMDKTLETYKAPPAAVKAFRACLEYAAGFEQNLADGRSLILCGLAGTGKTHIACGITRAVIEQSRVAAVYTTAGRLFRRVKDTYSKGATESEAAAIKALALPELLVIDEVGTTFGSDTERNILFEVVNERYEGLRPTILISNLAPENLAEFAGERVIDRMKENGGKLLKFDWPSHRSNKG